MMKKILRRAPLALACLAAFGAASAANVDPQLTASSRDADALIVFAKSSHTVAPLAPDADYKMRRRALVDSLRAQADVSQRDVRSWLDAHGIAYRSYWVSNVIEARLSQSAIAELAGRNDIASIKSNRAFAMPLPKVEQGTAPNTIEAIPYGVTKILQHSFLRMTVYFSAFSASLSAFVPIHASDERHGSGVGSVTPANPRPA